VISSSKRFQKPPTSPVSDITSGSVHHRCMLDRSADCDVTWGHSKRFLKPLGTAHHAHTCCGVTDSSAVSTKHTSTTPVTPPRPLTFQLAVAHPPQTADHHPPGHRGHLHQPQAPVPELLQAQAPRRTLFPARPATERQSPRQSLSQEQLAALLDKAAL